MHARCAGGLRSDHSDNEDRCGQQQCDVQASTSGAPRESSANTESQPIHRTQQLPGSALRGPRGARLSHDSGFGRDKTAKSVRNASVRRGRGRLRFGVKRRVDSRGVFAAAGSAKRRMRGETPGPQQRRLPRRMARVSCARAAANYAGAYAAGVDRPD